MFELIANGDEATIIARLEQIRRLPSLAQKREQLNVRLDGKTLVHAAVARGNLVVLQYLLQLLEELKIECNQQDTAGNTPLHDAVTNGDLTMVRELVAQDVLLTTINNANLTACQLAIAKYREGVNIEVFQQIVGLLRTSAEWQAAPAAAGFRFNKVIGLIEKSFPAIQPAGGTDKVFFIGGTGAGKSTFVNYMNGTRYSIEIARTGRPFAAAIGGEPEIARIGHGIYSQTLYPEVIQKAHLDFSYCDLPGLGNIRGDAARICASGSVQILSSLPGKIRGICLVLDIPSFNATRGAAFKDTAVALANMVKYNPRLMDSVYYIITKIPEECRSRETGEILTRPENIIDTYVDPALDALELNGGNPFEEIELEFMLQQMKQHRNNIIIPDITDEGGSRAALERLLTALPRQPSSDYNFVSHDGAQQAFNDSLQGIAEGYLARRAAIAVELPEQIRAQEAVEVEIETRIVDLQQQIAAREAEQRVPYNTAVINAQIAEINAQITRNGVAVTAGNAAILARTAEIGVLQGEMNSLNTPARRITELRNAISETHILNHHDSIDINRLNIVNDQLRESIIQYEREKIQGQANAQIRVNRLQAEIAVRQQWLAEARAELIAATARKVELQQQLADKNVEISVNQDLFNIVYRTARILDLGGIETIARFLHAFEAANPAAAGRYDQWFRDMLETARAQNRLAGLDLAAAPAGTVAQLPQFRAHRGPAFAAAGASAGADAGAEFIGDRARGPVAGIRRAAH